MKFRTLFYLRRELVVYVDVVVFAPYVNRVRLCVRSCARVYIFR